uniref:Uncharacterized protein n=1 Tax=Plectus sambesii TaxID=2011161 RepID=A0A914V578_9BILA
MDRLLIVLFGLLAVVLISVSCKDEPEEIKRGGMMHWIHRALPMRMKQHRYAVPFVRESELVKAKATEKDISEGDRTNWAMVQLS